MLYVVNPSVALYTSVNLPSESVVWEWSSPLISIFIVASATGSLNMSISVPFVIISLWYGVTSTMFMLVPTPLPVSIVRFVLFGPTTTLNVIVAVSALYNT